MMLNQLDGIRVHTHQEKDQTNTTSGNQASTGMTAGTSATQRLFQEAPTVLREEDMRPNPQVEARPEARSDVHPDPHLPDGRQWFVVTRGRTVGYFSEM